MDRYVIPALKRYGIIIAGPGPGDRAGSVEIAKNAVARWIDEHRPMRCVHVNGYGAIHCDVFADEEQLVAWSKDWTWTENGAPPGSLTFAIEKENR